MRSAAAERWVLALSLAGGVLLAFVTPPFQVPDEPAHLLHVYQVATAAATERGPGGAAGIRVPASLMRLADQWMRDLPFQRDHRQQPGLWTASWRQPLAPADTVWVPAGRLSPYTAVPYLGAAAAVALGRLAAAGPLALLYLARLGNLAVAVALSWAAVRLAPVQRWLIALTALTPMAMFQRSSASADAFTNAAALLVVSLVLRLALPAPAEHCGGEDRAGAAPAPADVTGGGLPSAGAPRAAADAAARAVRRPGLLVGWLLAGAFLLAAAKAVYFLLASLVVLVPAARLGSRRRAAMLWGGGAAAIGAGAAVSWWVAHFYFTQGFLRSGVQPLAQLHGVVAAPARFGALVLADYLRHAPRYGAELVGNFGWLDAPLPLAAMVAWAAVLLMVAATDGDRQVVFAGWQRLWTAAVAGATLLLLSLSQYLSWTPLGADRIDGLQGRYFLPLLPAGALLLYNRRLAGRWPCGAGAGLRLGVWSACFLVLTLATLWFRYHGGVAAAAGGTVP